MRWGRRILGWVWVVSVAASTLLFVAAVGMWGRSYWRGDHFHAAFAGSDTLRAFRAWSCWGAIELAWDTHPPLPADRFDWSYFSEPVALPTTKANPVAISYKVRPTTGTLGFSYQEWPLLTSRGPTPRLWTTHALTVPFWFPVVVAAGLPLIAIWRWRKKRRIAREGLCPVCGYDLRASGERCPECGTAIEGKHAIT